jgi:ASC-1-like (ASCH) protein
MKWKGKLISYIVEQLKDDPKWENTIERVLIDSTIGVHLAIFNEPFLSLILNGEKKIESRFSINKISPYGKVKKGDVIILKESGGFIKGIFIAGDVWFYHNLDKSSMRHIESQYGELICSAYDKEFWENRNRANYASLIEVKKIKKLPSYRSEKKDRSAWSVLKEGMVSSLFGLSL